MTAVGPPAATKAERYDAVADALVRTLLREGPAGLKIATIARRAKVSRAWVYKHFGSNTDDLVAYTARLLGDAFAELDRPNASEDADGWANNVKAATRRGLQDADEAPWSMHIWMRWRHERGPIGEALRGVQQRHAEKFVADMPAGLRQGPHAVAFALTFQAARIGVYHAWLDAAVREQVDRESLCRPLDDMVDGFVARVGAGSG